MFVLSGMVRKIGSLAQKRLDNMLLKASIGVALPELHPVSLATAQLHRAGEGQCWVGMWGHLGTMGAKCC